MPKFMVVCLVVCLATVAQAQEPPAEVEFQSAVPDAFLLKAGSWDVNVIAGAYEESFGGNDEILAFGGFDIEYFIRDRFALFAEALGYYIAQDGPDAGAFGLNLGARWYFWQPFENLAIYTEGGLGVIEANRRVPPGGTHHNFVEQLGLGAKLRVTDHVAIMAGVRYQHLSNASIHGTERNPAIDAFGAYGGLSMAF